MDGTAAGGAQTKMESRQVKASEIARDVSPLRVSGWRDTLHDEIGKRFTEATGIPVEYEGRETGERLSSALANKGNPRVDVTLTTTHVGRLYISAGLFEKLDPAKIGNVHQLRPEAMRSPYHIGLWSYIYTIAYLPERTPFQLTQWADLWDPRLKRMIAMPDFDPSHVITVSALLSGGDEFQWKRGIPRLLALKPNIAAFFDTDAQSQDLFKSGKAPVQILLSVNAHKTGKGRIQAQTINPADAGGIAGIDTIGVMAGTQRRDAAYKFVDIAISQAVQEDLARTLKVGPMNLNAAVPAEMEGRPGILTTPDDWEKHAYVLDDEQRAKSLPEWKEWFNANIVK